MLWLYKRPVGRIAGQWSTGDQGRADEARDCPESRTVIQPEGYEGIPFRSDESHWTSEGRIYRQFLEQEELATEAFDYHGKEPRKKVGWRRGVPDALNRLKKIINNFVRCGRDWWPGLPAYETRASKQTTENTVLRARARKALQSWIVRLSSVTSEGIKKRTDRSTG